MEELIAAFEPPDIHRGGKYSPGLGRWWSRKDQCRLKGLEIISLAIVNVAAGTPMLLVSFANGSLNHLKDMNDNFS
ncbi:MAG: hypothetical protein WKI04_04875 [Ferruginibacter sp.]